LQLDGEIIKKEIPVAEYMHLVGAEAVQSAANTMHAAAGEMSRAASSMQQAVVDHQRILENFLLEFQDILRRNLTEGE
jgi:hypothetical protein